MSTTTANLGLVKPALTDTADITAMNPNWDKVDTEIPKRLVIGDDYRPNILINGDFQVWQRGTNFISPNANYTADRWVVTNYLDTNIRVTKPTKGLRFEQAVAVSPSASSDLIYNVEDYSDFAGRTLTLSTDIALDKGIDIDIYIVDGGQTESLGTTSASGIKSFSHTITASPSQLQVIFRLYRSGVAIGTGVNINWIKLELNDHATPFIPRSYAEELAMCQRYYETGYAVFTAISTKYIAGYIKLVPKRVKSTFSFSNAWGNRNKVRNVISVDEEVGPITFTSCTDDMTLNGLHIMGIDSDSFKVGSGYAFYWYADAEI